MASVGGGWLSDIDVLPTFLSPASLPNKGNFTVYQGTVPALVSGDQGEWERMARQLMSAIERPSYRTVGADHITMRLGLVLTLDVIFRSLEP